MMKPDHFAIDETIEELLDCPYRIADLFPARVSSVFAEQYRLALKHFAASDSLSLIYRGYGEIVLILNCYYDLLVSFDGMCFDQIADAKPFLEKLSALQAPERFRCLLPKEKILLDLDPPDTWMCVYGNEPGFDKMFEALCQSRGFFLF